MSATLILFQSSLFNTPNSFPPSKLSLYSYTPISYSATQFQNRHPKPPKSFSLTTTTNKSPDFSVSSNPISHLNAAVNVPTAPWMKRPLLLQPHEVLNLSKVSKPRTKKNSSDRALTGKESGVRGSKAMKKIVKSIEKLRESGNSEETQKNYGEFGFGECLEQIGDSGEAKFERKMPWVGDEKVIFRRMKKENKVSAAELNVDKELLERLRGEAVKMRKWVKVKKAGVTQAVVDEIGLIWRRNELAMVKFDLPLCRNMERAQEIIEMKTGGLVVWSKKDALVVYRGYNYRLNSTYFPNMHQDFASGQESPSSKLSQMKLENNNNVFQIESKESMVAAKTNEHDGGGRPVATGIFPKENLNWQLVNGSLYERETDRLLDGLGPRFIDWWMRKPLPVDGDLLQEVVPGFRPPFRRCPPDAMSKLRDDELTYLRKLAHSLPTHFVLGRNRKLQGLAAAILKLWEKSLIVKISVKWGVPNTNNEQMAEELKCLTGGILLLRNKFFIILYRGKDFVPCRVSKLIAEREMELLRCQLNEEGARLRASETYSGVEPLANTSMIGSLSEFQDIQLKFRDLDRENEEGVQLKAERETLERELRKQERKLYILNIKIERSAKSLSELNDAWQLAGNDADQEMMAEEERECFRKIGLKMDSCLVLGRCGVFDGVIEGLHQHWKHREVVKVITMQRVFAQVIYTAKMLETESGGLLVSVEKLKEGHAIIIYRGKNYRRPLKPVPMNLLTKRKALHRSLEMQRLGSLKFFAYQRKRTISDLKIKLVNLQNQDN